MIGCGLLRGSTYSPTVIALAWIVVSSLSVQGESIPTGAQSADCSVAGHLAAAAREETTGAITMTGPFILTVRGSSFPELSHIDLRVRAFRSQSDYFRTRFSVSRFLLLIPMRYFVDVNPALFLRPPPSDGVCAILAHELAHVVSLSSGNRIRRLGLIRLLSQRYTVKFERGADLEAIHRGYGDGLKTYRSWVYSHVPSGKVQEKRRNYFSPEEITVIQVKLQKQPELFQYWSRHVPTNLDEIQRTR